MAKIQHAPGPWTASVIGDITGPDGCIGTAYAFRHPGERRTASEVRANAKIMAAGPCLADALERLLYFTVEGFDEPSDLIAAINESRAALKAAGRLE